MKIDSVVSWIQAHCERFNGLQKRILLVGISIACLALFFFLFKGVFAFAVSWQKKPVLPMLIREGNDIIIPKQSALRSQLLVKAVHFSTKSHVVSFPGLVEAEPSKTVSILPPLTGRLVRLDIKLGEEVKKGQVLAVLRSPPLTQAYAEWKKAQSIWKWANTSLTRAEKVHHAGGNSIKEVERARNTVLQAEADLKQTDALLKALGKKNSPTLLKIRAPIDGRITSLHYGLGSYINDLTVPMFILSNIGSVWVVANIPENLVGVVRPEQPVEVVLPAYPKHKWYGTVSFVNVFLEPDTRRNKTRIAFANPEGKLQPNMFAAVNIMVSEPHQIMIPLSAVLMNDDTTSVYVETKPWVFKRRRVELGMEDGDQIRILSGLTSGERVVVSGGIFVND